MSDEITLRIPDLECPFCGEEPDLEDCDMVIIIICPKCEKAFEYGGDESKLH